MKRLAAALLPTTVEVSDRLYRVGRPSVEQAITILSISEAMAERDSSGLGELRRVAFEWLGIGPASVLFASRMDAQESMRVLLGLLRVGLPESHKKDEEKVTRSARVIGWMEVVATYARFYNTTPTGVLREPWPLFVAMGAQIDVLKAREQMDNASWYAGAKTGKMKGIQERAFGTVRLRFESPDFMRKQDWKEKQLDTIARLRQRMGRA